MNIRWNIDTHYMVIIKRLVVENGLGIAYSDLMFLINPSTGKSHG